jgi:hypothetical protein
MLALRFPLQAMAATLLAVSCQSPVTAPAELLVGDGILSVSTCPPDVEPCAAPVWGSPGFLTLGSELIFQRGSDQAHFKVSPHSEGGWQMTDVATGVSLIFDANLADLGKDLPNNSGPMLRLMPGDPVLHFPLWENKTWSANFYSHGMRRDPIGLRAEYHCDAREWVETPAGKYNCYRIWRKVMLAEGDSEHRLSLYWYAPEVGFIIKRLDDSKLLELHQILGSSD